MEYREISARTVEEAIQLASEQLGVSPGDLKVTVLKEGKSGILGLGHEDALIRVETPSPAPGPEKNISEVARDTLEKLLGLLDVTTTIQSQEGRTGQGEVEDTAPVSFDIRGDDLGILIGRRGTTLASLQYILRLIVGHQTRTWIPIVIDVEGYKQRRYGALQSLALRMAEQVKAKGSPFALEPMPPYERRIIHLTLADHPDVTTESIGEGDFRKVVILLRRPQ
jgi:spoIIIJ-associated protein